MLDLVRRQNWIEGNADRPTHDTGEVAQEPFRSVLGKDRNTVSWHRPEGFETERQPFDVVVQTSMGNAFPYVSSLVLDGVRLSKRIHRVEEQLGDVAIPGLGGRARATG